MLNLRAINVAQGVDGLGEREVATVDLLKGTFDQNSGLARDACPSKLDGIRTVDKSRVPFAEHVGRKILGQFGHRANHGHGSNRDKLMDPAHASDDSLIFDLNVTGEGCATGDDDLVSDLAVVSNVDGGHQQVVVADAGLQSHAGGPVDGDHFTDDVAIANHGVGLLALELEILRNSADYGTGKDLAITADGGEGFNHGVGRNGSPIADLAMIPDDGIRADFDVFANLGGGMNKCLRMNIDHVSPPWKTAIRPRRPAVPQHRLQP